MFSLRIILSVNQITYVTSNRHNNYIAQILKGMLKLQVYNHDIHIMSSVHRQYWKKFFLKAVELIKLLFKLGTTNCLVVVQGQVQVGTTKGSNTISVKRSDIRSPLWHEQNKVIIVLVKLTYFTSKNVFHS